MFQPEPEHFPKGNLRLGAPVAGADLRSHDVHAVSSTGCRSLAAVGEAAVVGGGAVHVRRLQLHLAGGDGGVELDLSPVHHVEHQADADDDLRPAEE